MRSITIRELHEQTEQLVQEASRHDGIVITEKVRAVAMLTPARGSGGAGKPLPHREPLTLPTTRADSTVLISEERDA